MKKALYIIFLLAELVVGFGLLILVTSITDWMYFWTVTAVWAVLTALVLVKRKRTPDVNGKRKVSFALALVMLIPAAAALAGLGWFIWAMSSAGLI